MVYTYKNDYVIETNIESTERVLNICNIAHGLFVETDHLGMIDALELIEKEVLREGETLYINFKDMIDLEEARD